MQAEKVRTVYAVPLYAPEVFPAAEFLELINNGLPNAPLQEQHAYVFTKKVDCVLIGPCSDGYITPRGQTTGGLIFGKTVSWQNGEHVRAFRQLLKEESGVVLLLSDCCGPYLNKFVAALKCEFPKITWLTPPHSDYCGNATSRDIARDLKNACIIRE